VRPRILVIDDESAIRDSLKMTLEYDGYDVMLAATGEEGVKLIEREAPDLVFSTSRCPAWTASKCCRSCGISSKSRPS
jgi:two-component system response regulator MprA